MLQNLTQLYGHKLRALDGDIGHIKDFYFDDESWVIRYLVADTGSWLTGRQVLLSPHAFGKWDGEFLHVNLTRKQIEHSPSPEAHKPVSRQYEEEYYRYYGWPTYWEGTDVWGLGGFPMVIPPPPASEKSLRKARNSQDKHLRSTHAVAGSVIEGPDGITGHVSGFLVDDRSWEIRDLVAETGHWFAGKEVIIPSTRVKKVSYEESKVFITLTQTELQEAGGDKIAHVGPGDSHH